MRISYWSSDVCSSDLGRPAGSAHALGAGIILADPVLQQCLEDRHPFLDQKFAAALGEHDGELAGGAGIGGCGGRAEMFEAHAIGRNSGCGLLIEERKSGGEGKRGVGRVGPGGRRSSQKKKQRTETQYMKS